VRDLPAAWDDAYLDLLGLRAPSVADGVLQDIHWSMGAFGYFPTYALGNLINAQLFRARAYLVRPRSAFARGEFRPCSSAASASIATCFSTAGSSSRATPPLASDATLRCGARAARYTACAR
jgi:Zn-dependent M32 family carboxypeptidase